MFRKSLQQRIILIFFVIVAVILITIASFAYIKIKQIYRESLENELKTASIGFASSITNDNVQDYLNFIKYFGIDNNQRKGYLYNSNKEIIANEDNSISYTTLDLETNKRNTVVENQNYEYEYDIQDNNGNVKYYVYVIQDKVFINAQLLEYKIYVYIFITILLAITLIIASAISRDIINPINKLSKNLEDIINGNVEQIEEIKITNTNNEISDLVTKFKLMTNQLNDNLREISNQKSQIETILLHMSDGVMAFDVYGNLIFNNPSAKKLLNIENENKFDDIFKKLEININLEKIIYLQDWTSSEKNLNIKDVYVNMFFETFKNDDNVIEGVIVLIQDITEQVKLDDMRKEFVANVSHELKTPITSIKSYSEALLDNKVDTDTHDRFLRVIANEAERMSMLVTDLLQLSKFDINKEQNKKSEFDLGELVKKTYEKISIEAQKRGHEVECYVTADVPKIYADKTGIEQVILNVISNAIKYTPDYGQIKIYVGFVYNHAYIKVIDNGIGIPKKDIKRVFERFFRVDKARSREQGGTGLGLAIAKEIVERNNGSIDITSELNEGTEVIIRLPVKQEK